MSGFKTLLCVVLTCLLLTGVNVHALEKAPREVVLKESPDNSVLTIAGSRNLKPFSFLDENGEPAGFGIDLWRLWSQKTGRTIQFRLSDISRSIQDLKDGRANLHVGMVASEENASSFLFTETYLQVPVSLYHLYEDGIKKKIDDFSRARIGVRGELPTEYFNKLFPNALMLAFENIRQMIDATERGDIDAFVAYGFSVDQVLIQLGMRGQFVAVEPEVAQLNLAAAVNTSDSQLLNEIEDGLNAISRKEIESVLKHWLGETAEHRIVFPRQIGVGLTQEEQQWLKQHRTMRIAVDPNYAPYEFLDDSQQYRGVSADFLKEIGALLGVDFELVPTKSWDESLIKGKEKAVDLLPLINRTTDRESFFLFTNPYVVSQRVIITRGQRDDIQGEMDLPEHILALPAGYSINAHIKERFPSVSIKEVKDIPTALLQVALGAADATILSLGVASFWLDQMEISNLRIAGEFGYPSLLSMAVRKDWPELIPVLQKALNTVSEPDKKRIRQRWISLDPESVVKEDLQLTSDERSWLLEHPVLRVSGSGDSQPISFLDESGKYKGLVADYLTLIEDRLGVDFIYISQDNRSQMLDQIQGRELDLIGGISSSDERRQYLAFSLPISTIPYEIYIHHDALPIKSMNSLKGKRVAVERDYYLHERLSIEYPTIELVVVDSTQEALDVVNAGKADAYIGNRSVADWTINQYQLEKIKSTGPAFELGKSELRIGVRKDWVMLESIIDKVLASITPEEHRTIHNRWLPHENGLLLTPEEKVWLAEHQTIEVGVMNAWPPLDFIGEKGKARGIGADIVHALNKRLGGVLKLHSGTWDEIYNAVKDKQIPALMNITPHPDREEYFLFTSPYIKIPYVIITHKDALHVNNINGLDGKRVAVEKGFITAKLLAEKYPNIDLLEYQSTSDALDAVSRQAADAYVGNRAVALFLIERELISNLRLQAKIDDIASVNAIGIRKDWPILKKILQKTLNDISEDEYQSILRKWVPNVQGRKELPVSSKKTINLTEAEKEWIKEHRRVRIGIDTGWEPIEYVTESGEYKGISAEFMRRITELTGIEFIHDPKLTWVDVIDKTKKGEIDVIPALNQSADRSEFLGFTKSYLHFPMMVFTRNEYPIITGIEDLSGETVAVERGYYTNEILNKHYPDIRLLVVETTHDALNAVATGIADAYVGNLTMGSYMIDKSGFGNIKVAAPTPYSNDLSIGVRKDWPELQSILEKALAGIDENDRRAIRQDSLQIRYDVEVDYTLVWKVVGGATILLLLSFLWLAQIKRQKQALASAKAEAEQANRFKSYFLANMSHEIRTPMNAIIGFSHLALQSVLTPRQQNYVEKINHSAHALLGIINDILDFSKIEAGKLTVEHVAFSLEEVFQNLANLTAIKAEEKGLEILFDRDIEIPDKLIGDPLRLGQVLTNLVSNAIKFTEKGEVTVSVKIHTEEEKAISLLFSVKDTGIGIDPEHISRLFDAFTQLDGSTSRKYGGSGLGLSICHHLIHLMGGTIKAESAPNVGSTFRFVLPFEVQEANIETNWLPNADIRGLRALVVDDNESARTILSNRLNSFTFDVSCAASAREALQMVKHAEDIQDNPYRVILMDWNMPEMNGIDAGKKIKHEMGLKQIPVVILVTAFGREEVMFEADEAGLDGFLLKPVSPSMLFETVLRSLNQSDDNSKIPAIRTSKKKYLLGDVLLVEDNTINQQVAQELLQNMGLTVHVANNGIEALKKLRESHYDMVLMDIQMPEMDGYETTRRIRLEPEFSSLPVVAMTAHAMMSEREKCLAAGMNEHIPKPIDPEKLFVILNQWLKSTDYPYLADSGNLQEEENIDLPDSLPGIDIHWGIERIGGNKKLYRKLLIDFVDNHGNAIQLLEDGIASGDDEAVRREVHTLQGVAGNIGANELQQAAKEMESKLLDGEIQKIEDIPETFRIHYENLIKGLSVYADSVREEVSSVEEQEQSYSLKHTADTTAILVRLEKMLAEGDTAAGQLVEEIGRIQKDAELQDNLNLIAEHIASYDFDKAQESLKVLSAHIMEKTNEY